MYVSVLSLLCTCARPGIPFWHVLPLGFGVQGEVSGNHTAAAAATAPDCHCGFGLQGRVRPLCSLPRERNLTWWSWAQGAWEQSRGVWRMHCKLHCGAVVKQTTQMLLFDPLHFVVQLDVLLKVYF